MEAPALNTALYRFDESEIRFILVYVQPSRRCRPGSRRGGPMNSQQIDNLIAYMKSIQILVRIAPRGGS